MNCIVLLLLYIYIVYYSPLNLLDIGLLTIIIIIIYYSCDIRTQTNFYPWDSAWEVYLQEFGRGNVCTMSHYIRCDTYLFQLGFMWTWCLHNLIDREIVTPWTILSRVSPGDIYSWMYLGCIIDISVLGYWYLVCLTKMLWAAALIRLVVIHYVV